jgi:tetratricopeptide (TPR) repeat protein
MRIFLLLLLAAIQLPAYSQSTDIGKIDSLQRELARAPKDSSKIKLLDNLAYTWSAINPDSGLAKGYEARALSEELKWQKGLAMAYADIGINLAAKSELTTAITYDQKALTICRSLGDSSGVAGNMANISLAYMQQGSYPSALEYAFKALNLYEDLGDKKNIAIISENIGTLYFEQKNYKKTSLYYSKAQKAYKELGDPKGVTRNLGNAGIVADAEGHYNEALKYHMEALQMNEASGNKKGEQINLANVGYVYYHMQQYEQALRYQFRALAMSRQLHNDNSMAIDLGNIGETYIAMAANETGNATKAKLNEAVKYLEQAVSLCHTINLRGPLIEYSLNLSKAYEKLGNYQRSFETYKEYTRTKDSVFSLEKITQIARLENQRASELKDKDLLLKDKQLQIQKLKISEKRNESVLYIISIVLLIVLTAIALKTVSNYRRSNRMLAQERQRHLSLIEEQIKHIKIRNEVLEEIAHMQAHDIRGPVATILGLTKVFDRENIAAPENKTVIDGIATIAEKLDDVIKEIIRKKTSLDK